MSDLAKQPPFAHGMKPVFGLSRHSPAAACAAKMRQLPVAHSLG